MARAEHKTGTDGWSTLESHQHHEKDPMGRPTNAVEVITPNSNLFPSENIADLCALSRTREEEPPLSQEQQNTRTPFGSSVNVVCDLHGVTVCVAPYSDPETIMRAWQNAVLGNYQDFISIQKHEHPLVGPNGGNYPAPEDPGTNGEAESIAFGRERYIALRNYFAKHPCSPFPDWPSGDTCGTNEIARPSEGEREDALDRTLAWFWMKLIHEAVENSDGQLTVKDVAEDTLRRSGLYYRDWFRKDNGAAIQNLLAANLQLEAWPHTQGLQDWLRYEMFPVENLPELPGYAR